MAVGKFRMYNNAKENWADSDWDLDASGDAFVAVLLTNAYTQADTHTLWSQLSTAEVTGGNYARKVLGGQSIEMGTGGNAGKIYWKATKVAFGSPTTDTTITAKYAALIRRSGTGTNLATSDPPVGFVDLDTGGTGTSSANGKFEVRWNSVDGTGTLFTGAGLATD